MGECHYQLGQMKEAIADFEKAVAGDPQRKGTGGTASGACSSTKAAAPTRLTSFGTGGLPGRAGDRSTRAWLADSHRLAGRHLLRAKEAPGRGRPVRPLPGARRSSTRSTESDVEAKLRQDRTAAATSADSVELIGDRTRPAESDPRVQTRASASARVAPDRTGSVASSARHCRQIPQGGVGRGARPKRSTSATSSRSPAATAAAIAARSAHMSRAVARVLDVAPGERQRRSWSGWPPPP